ncbi:MAG TPA: putative glycoside hydrolase [Gemmatimonadales bacterium]|nr:putative glycoside hydrolase [Gemmatimonadales bacterium]
MAVVRQAGALLLAALVLSRGLFAQGDSTPGAPSAPVVPAAPTPPDEAKVSLRPVEIRYVQQESVLLPQSRSIKGLYVNAWAFGSPKLWELVRLADATEINAFVVDVKDDTGCLLYPSAVPTAQQIGANQCVRAKDVRARLDTLGAHDIYPIARIVVAKDPLLAERKPAWSVKERETGALWRDRINIAWVDAYNDSVWIYAAQLAAEAVRLGFAEVQFDYVRFPDEPRERMATAVFPAHRSGVTQREAVRRHVELLADRLRPLGVPVTFDIFGLTASATGDLGIGQVWEDFANEADVVLPMVYPSHYYRGAFGFAWPNGQPYRVVRSALKDALERSRPLPGSAEIRPFLQAFTLGRRLPRYTPYEIREQIRAAEDVGITSWVLWNPRSVYQRDALRPKQGGSPPVARVLSTATGGR